MMREDHLLTQHQTGARQPAFEGATARHLSNLVEWSQRLIAQERPLYSDLLPLFGRVYDEIQPVTHTEWLYPVAATSDRRSIEQSDASYFVEGLTAARVLVWTLHDDRTAGERLPRLVVAALLQDIGRLFAAGILKRLKGRSANRAEWLERHHPSVGAALVAALQRAPVELPLLVAQHHERLDGGGFPGALVAREIVADAAILAAATRFAQLCAVPHREPSAAPGHRPELVQTATLFYAEAKCGKWPVDFANRLRNRIAAIEQTPGLHERPHHAAPAEWADARGLSDARADEHHRRLDDDETALRGVHLGSGERFAATTLDEIRRIADKKAARSE